MQESLESGDIKRTGHNWLDMLLGLSAIFVSLCSLYLAHNSSDAMERLVQANSLPFLQLESGNATDDGTGGHLAFSIRNAGTGPASVHTFEYVVDGVPTPHRGYIAANVIRACCAAELEQALARTGGDVVTAIDGDLTSPIGNTFLASNDESHAWQWRLTAVNAALWEAVDQARQEGRIKMRACYCSLFDECWITETGLFPPRPVNSCTPEAPRSEQRQSRATPPAP